MPYKDPAARLAHSRAYNAKNRERIRAKQREMRYDLMHEYGLSVDRYREMMEAQEGCCLICLKKSDVLCVDHDHTTGKIRGLLCKRCNAGLGQFLDDVASLARAIEYLAERKRDERVQGST